MSFRNQGDPIYRQINDHAPVYSQQYPRYQPPYPPQQYRQSGPSQMVGQRVRPERAQIQVAASEYRRLRQGDRPSPDSYSQANAVRYNDGRYQEQRQAGPNYARPSLREPPNDKIAPSYQPHPQLQPRTTSRTLTEEKNAPSPYANKHKRNNKFIYLSNRDFVIGQGAKGPVIRAEGLKGFFLVAFIADNCVHCENLLETMSEIHESVPHCNLSILNFSEGANIEVAKKSQKTILPIKSTPVIVMYVDGKPFMRYDGARTANGLIRFVDDVINLFNQSKGQREGNDGNDEKNEEERPNWEELIPGFTVGIPYNMVCNDVGKCYFQYDDLYDPKRRSDDSQLCLDGKCCFLTYGELYDGPGVSSSR